VTDRFYREAYPELIGISYSGAPRLRDRPPGWGTALPANPLSEPDPARAVRHELVLQGGAMGTLREAEFDGERRPLQELFRTHQLAWAINGVTVKGHAHTPLVTLKRGESCVLAVMNDTAWHHPLHMHGHFFRVVTRNGEATRHREWCDTVLLAPRERVEVAFVAGEPGDWMLHCHVLAHQSGGMMATMRVL
jgi:FtsP/CotA-like multicopper oxidase with cupredoxin domain